MKADFRHPQRQSPIGVLVMFFDTVRHFVKALWPVMVVSLFGSDANKTVFMFATAGLLVMISIVAYLKFRNFTFFIDEENDEFVISEGVFNKTRTSLRLDKIQQVNISQSFIQRFIGVYALEIDTAGSNDEEAKIKAVSHDLALLLKARLLENERRPEHVGVDPELKTETSAPVIKISFLTLVKVGITSNYMRTIALLTAFFMTTADNLRRIDSPAINGEQFSGYFEERLIMQSVLVLTVLAILAVLLINLFRVIFIYFDFKATLQRGSLLLSHGLLNNKSTIIKPEKVQITTLTRNYFQKKMDIMQIQIRQANGGVATKNTLAAVPGCNQNESDAILKLLFGTVPTQGVMLKPNIRKIVFSFFWLIVLPLIIFFGLAYFTNVPVPDFSALMPPYLILIGIYIYFSFRNHRLFVNDNFIVKQSGAWDVSKEIITPDKIQALSSSQLFWHKSLDLATLTIHTAGGDIRFQLGNYTKLKQYMNLWLYRIEASNSNWM